jgi:hypothetical protein
VTIRDGVTEGHDRVPGAAAGHVHAGQIVEGMACLLRERRGTAVEAVVTGGAVTRRGN